MSNSAKWVASGIAVVAVLAGWGFYRSRAPTISTNAVSHSSGHATQESAGINAPVASSDSGMRNAAPRNEAWIPVMGGRQSDLNPGSAARGEFARSSPEREAGESDQEAGAATWSDSALRMCADAAADGYYCQMVHRELDLFAKEARDETWAAHTESRLREIVRRDPRELAVSFLQCRSSLCLLEISSKDLTYIGLMYEEVAPLGLIPGVIQESPYWILPGTVFGFEGSPDGGKLKVVLNFLSRRR